MADFEAKVRSILDKSSLQPLKDSIETGLAGKAINLTNFKVDTNNIRSQIESGLSKAFDIKINVSGAGTSAGKKIVTDLTANLNRSLVSGVNIGNTANVLSAIGFDQKSIDEATKNLTKSLQEVEYKIKSIRSVEKINKDGKAAGGRISIDAYDKLGNLVNVVQSINLDGTLGAQTRSVLQSFEQGTQAAKHTIEDLNNTLNSTANFNAFTSVLEDFNKLETGSTELVASVTNLKNAFAAMSNTSLSDDDRLKALEKYNEALKESERLISETIKQQRTGLKSDTLQNRAQTLIAKTQKWLNDNPRAAAEFGDQLSVVIQQLGDKNLSGDQFTNLASQINTAKASAQQLGLTASPLIQTLKQLLGITSTVAIAQKGIQTVKQMAQETIKVDTAMTELRRVTNLSSGEEAELYDRMTQSAKEYGAELNTMINSTASWVRLGFDSNTANKLAEVSTMYQHVTDLDEKTAVNNLVTAYMGYKDSLLKATSGDEVAAITRISDVFDKLGNVFPATAAEVGEGLTKSASVLQSAGASFEEASAMVTGAGAVTQDFAGAGGSLKIATLRIRGMKGELQDIGEDISDVIPASKMQTEIINLTKGIAGFDKGINILEKDGKTFRNIYDIFNDIAKVIPELEKVDETKAAELIELIAGKNRSNAILGMLENWEMVKEARDAALNSQGTSAAENAIYMDSLQGRIDSLKASWQSLSSDFVQSDFLKGVITLVNGFVDLLDGAIDKLGVLKTLAVGGGISKVLKGFMSLSSVYKGSGNEAFESLDKFLMAFGTKGGKYEKFYNTFEKAGGGLSGLKAALSAAIAPATTLFTTLASIAAVVAAIGAVSWIVYTGSMDYAIKQSEKARDVLANETSEVNKLESSRIENLKKIEELQSKSNRNALDDSEIEKLRVQNRLLDAQLEVQKKIQKEAERAAAEQAANVLTKQIEYDNPTGEILYNEDGSAYYNSIGKNIIDATGEYVKESQNYRKELVDISNEIRDIENSDKTEEEISDALVAINERKTDVESKLKELDANILSNKDIILKEYGALVNPDGSAKSGFEDIVTQIEELIPELNPARFVAKNAFDTNRSWLSTWYNGLDDTEKEFAFKLIMDADSAKWDLEKFNEELSTTKAIADAIANANTLDNFKNIIDSAKNAQATLQSAYSNSYSATGLTGEDIEQLNSTFKSIDGYDPSILFAKTSNGVRLNNELFKEYSEQLENITSKNILEKIIDKTNALNEARKKGDEAAISNIEKELQMYQLLSAEYDASTSKYNKYIAATSSANARDSFDGVAKGFKSVGELIKQGWTTDDSVTTYLDLLLGTDRIQDSEAAYKQLSDTISGTSPSLKDYFTLDSSGNLTSSGLWKFIDDIKNVQGNIGDGSEIVKVSDDGIYSLTLASGKLKEVAGYFGTTTEMIELMSQALADAGMDVTFASSAEKVEILQKKMDDLREKISEGGKDVEKYKQQLDSASKQMVSINIKSQIDGGKTVSELYGMSDEELSATLEIDTSQVAEARKQLVELSTLGIDIPLNVKLDETQFAQLLGSKTAPTANGVAEYTPSFNYDLTAPTVYGTAIYKKSFVGGVASGTALSIAHSSGTAYNMYNLCPAHAAGDISLGGNEDALVNELNQESIVRNGRWFLLPPGPHIEHLKKGDIIFNARQTRELLNAGKAATYGHAYAAGTVLDKNPELYATDKRSKIPKNMRDAVDSLIIEIQGSKPSSSDSSGGGKPGSGGGGSNSSASKDGLEKVDWIEVVVNKINKALEKLNKVATSAFKSLATRFEAFGERSAKILEAISVQTKASERYQEEAAKVELDDGLKELVRNGTIDINEYDEATRKLIDEYKKWYEASEKAADAIDDLHENLAQLHKEQFDAAQKDAENQIAQIDHIANQYDSQVDLIKEKGYMLSSSMYESLINVEYERQKALSSELDSLQRKFDEAMASGEIEEGSEAFYEMQNSINGVKESLDDSTLSIQKYANEIRNIQWEYFDFLQKRIEGITSESEYLINLLSRSKLFDENGNITERGNAVIGLRAQNYNVLMAQADAYAKELKSVSSDLANDPNNIKLIERRDELLSLQQKSILAAEDEKDAIASLVKEGIESELSSMKKLIDGYNDTLDSAKSLYDYQKKIKSGASDVAKIQKQLSVYEASGDTSDANRARIQKLQVELESAQDKLLDDEYDRYVSDQKKLLDDLYKEYEETLNNRIDDTNMLVNEVINSVNTNSGTISETISSATSEVGYAVSAQMEGVWSRGFDTVAYYNQEFSSKITSIQSVLEAINYSVSKMGSGGIESQNDFVSYLDSISSSGLSLSSSSIGGSFVSGAGIPSLTAINDISGLSSGIVYEDRHNENVTFGDINITIPIDHVDDYDNFVSRLRDDDKFERLVQEMTIGKLTNKNPLSKKKYTW